MPSDPSGSAPAGSLISRIASAAHRFGSFVKFSHTIFALPFALSMFLLVARDYPAAPWQFSLILVALVAARTAAMAYNRILDRDIDARNPRTNQREIPRGEITVRTAYGILSAAVLAFLLTAGALGRHCMILAPLVLLILFAYSWTKRFTRYSHLVLGASLALAPGGVWYAITAEWSWIPVWMMLGVLCWVAGFDILYSCQDVDFDRRERLRSIPAVVGIPRAFAIARVLHVMAIVALVVFGFQIGVGVWYWLGLAAFAALLASQHRIISPDSLARIDAAFFTRNGIASILYFVGVLLDTL